MLRCCCTLRRIPLRGERYRQIETRLVQSTNAGRNLRQRTHNLKANLSVMGTSTADWMISYFLCLNSTVKVTSFRFGGGEVVLRRTRPQMGSPSLSKAPSISYQGTMKISVMMLKPQEVSNCYMMLLSVSA